MDDAHSNPLDPVWRALADPTRRDLLDLLRTGPKTTGQLVEAVPMLSRFGVMKHLGVLEEAGLLTVSRQGRQRYNHLNAVPLRQIYERWVSKYEDTWAGSLLSLKRLAGRKEQTMSAKISDKPARIAHVAAQIDIKAKKETVFEAWFEDTHKWFFETEADNGARPRFGLLARRGVPFLASWPPHATKKGFSAPEALNVGHGCLVLPGASTRARTAAFESGAVVAASETPSMSAARPRARALRSGSPLGACGGRARARWRCACSVYVCEYKVACTKKKCLHFVLHRIRVTQLARAALRPSERARARKVNYPVHPRRATRQDPPTPERRSEIYPRRVYDEFFAAASVHDRSSNITQIPHHHLGLAAGYVSLNVAAGFIGTGCPTRRTVASVSWGGTCGSGESLSRAHLSEWKWQRIAPRMGQRRRDAA